MMQQAQPMQLSPLVINALNALQGPLVLPGMGGVIGVDGLGQNVQIPQLTVSNVLQVCVNYLAAESLLTVLCCQGDASMLFIIAG